MTPLIRCRASVGNKLLTFTIDTEMPRNQITVSCVQVYRSPGRHSMLTFYNRGGATGCWAKVLEDDAFNIAARLLGCLVTELVAAYEERALPF